MAKKKRKGGAEGCSVTVQELTPANLDHFLSLVDANPLEFLAANPWAASCPSCGTYTPPELERCPGCGKAW